MVCVELAGKNLGIDEKYFQLGGRTLRALKLLMVSGLLMLAAAGCGGASGTGGVASTGTGEGKVKVATTISVLQDMVRNVGGDRVDVFSIVPVGGSPETFQPSPSETRRVAESKVVFQNGEGLEEWLSGFMDNAGGNQKVVTLSDGLPAIDNNPHFWLNVKYGEHYVERIRDTLIKIDPAGADVYRQNAARYLNELQQLDNYVRQQSDSIPADRRKLVTFHDAFPYFAQAYGFDLVGVVLQNPNAEPSSRQVADLVNKIREQHVPAIFVEPQFNPKLGDTIAREANVKVYETYTDTLVNNPSGDSYIAMMRTDIDTIAKALK